MNNMPSDFMGWLKEDIRHYGKEIRAFWLIYFFAVAAGSGLGWLVWRIFFA